MGDPIVTHECFFSDKQIDSLWNVFNDDITWKKKMIQALSQYGIRLCPECRGDKVVKSKTAPCFISCPTCDGKEWVRIK